MSTGLKLATLAGIAVLCLGTASATSAHSQRKAKKPPLPPLPSGPTGPVQQIPLDSIAPVSPQVSYQAGLLTIVAPNSTLGDILRAVRKQTGAEIEVPEAKDRVVTHLGPGPAREVVLPAWTEGQGRSIERSRTAALEQSVLCGDGGLPRPSGAKAPLPHIPRTSALASHLLFGEDAEQRPCRSPDPSRPLQRVRTKKTFPLPRPSCAC